jgi:hypothetical protein
VGLVLVEVLMLRLVVVLAQQHLQRLLFYMVLVVWHLVWFALYTVRTEDRLVAVHASIRRSD